MYIYAYMYIERVYIYIYTYICIYREYICVYMCVYIYKVYIKCICIYIFLKEKVLMHWRNDRVERHRIHYKSLARMEVSSFSISIPNPVLNSNIASLPIPLTWPDQTPVPSMPLDFPDPKPTSLSFHSHSSHQYPTLMGGLLKDTALRT